MEIFIGFILAAILFGRILFGSEPEPPKTLEEMGYQTVACDLSATTTIILGHAGCVEPL